LDTLFYYRSCPVHLLFATDEEGERLVKIYLKRRNFDNIKYSFYQSNLSDEVKEAVTQTRFRYSTALAKIEAHNLFTDIDDLLLVDFDMVFTNDICISAHKETMRMKEVYTCSDLNHKIRKDVFSL
jgi:pyruvate kinase